MKFTGVAFFPHAFPARGLEIGRVRVQIAVAPKKPARYEDGRAGGDAKVISEGVVHERLMLHGV